MAWLATPTKEKIVLWLDLAAAVDVKYLLALGSLSWAARSFPALLLADPDECGCEAIC